MFEIKNGFTEDKTRPGQKCNRNPNVTTPINSVCFINT